jgi:RNA polymerase sigma-70 factor, ECF subfamily
MESQLLDEPTDTGLLQRAKVGDFAAFQQLVAKLQPRVYGLTFRILQQTQDAEDATQQTFLALIEHIADIREESSVATWVLKIATNYTLKILRKKRGGKMVSITDMASDDTYNDIPHPEFIAPWSQTADEIVQQAELQEDLEADQTRTINEWSLNHKKAMADEVQDADRSPFLLEPNSRNPRRNM